MFTAMEMPMCPNLAVPAEVMRHVVQVESGANPFAIGVVGGQLVRQPVSLDEALATVQMLDAKGYDYSLGVAQVNRRNLGRYGLDTYAKAFDACANVAAGAQILAECYGRSGTDWGKAFSCYYSGNFVTGYRDGYVQKVYASMQADAPTRSRHAFAPIPLKPFDGPRRAAVAKVLRTAGTPGYRVSIRSSAIDNTANAAVSAVANAMTERNAASADRGSAASLAEPSAPYVAPPLNQTAAIFKPVVRGPNDPARASSQSSTPTPTVAPSGADRADLRQEQRDAAFVF